MNYLSGSKTYIGLAVVLIPTVAKMFGYDVSETFSDDFTKLADEFVVLLGSAIAFYGRSVAKVPGLLAKKD